MTEEIKEYLREHLSVSVREENNFGSQYFVVSLVLDGVVISSDTFTVRTEP